MSCAFFDVPAEIYNKINCNTCPVQECCKSMLVLDEAVMDLCRECVNYAFKIQEQLWEEEQ